MPPITGALQISGSATGMPSGQKVIGPTAISIASGVGTVTTHNFVAGFNSIAVPTGATVAVIVPPPANTQTMVLKGVTGDTGIALARTLPAVLTFDAGVATFGITAGGTINGVEISWL